MAKEPITRNHIRRKSKNGPKNPQSVNKYAHLVPKRLKAYDSLDKTYREFAFTGVPGQVFKAGTRLTFHGRLYQIMSDVTIPKVTIPENSIVEEIEDGKQMIYGKCKLVTFIKK